MNPWRRLWGFMMCYDITYQIRARRRYVKPDAALSSPPSGVLRSGGVLRNHHKNLRGYVIVPLWVIPPVLLLTVTAISLNLSKGEGLHVLPQVLFPLFASLMLWVSNCGYWPEITQCVTYYATSWIHESLRNRRLATCPRLPSPAPWPFLKYSNLLNPKGYGFKPPDSFTHCNQHCNPVATKLRPYVDTVSGPRVSVHAQFLHLPLPA